MSAKRFLKRSTVTDVVSVTMSGDDVFSTDFRWYWINCTARNTTANSPNFDMRLTVGGLPHTKGVYQMSGTDLNADASRSDVNFSDTDRIPIDDKPACAVCKTVDVAILHAMKKYQL